MPFICNGQQQYHVVPFRIGWVRVKMGLGLTGVLGRAWVGALVVHGYGWCMVGAWGVDDVGGLG